MRNEAECREQADALLRLAAATDNMKERGQLIDEAMHWHNLALDAGADHADDALDGGDEAEARV